MKALLIAALLLAGGTAPVLAETYGVSHNRFCKIEAVVAITEEIMNGDNDAAGKIWDEALKTKQCTDIRMAQSIEILDAASAVMTDKDGNIFIIVRVSEKGWYTWAIKGHNTNYPIGEGA